VTGVAATFFAITRIEVITEFRRLELIAEEHARVPVLVRYDSRELTRVVIDFARLD